MHMVSSYLMRSVLDKGKRVLGRNIKFQRVWSMLCFEIKSSVYFAFERVRFRLNWLSTGSNIFKGKFSTWLHSFVLSNVFEGVETPSWHLSIFRSRCFRKVYLTFITSHFFHAFEWMVSTLSLLYVGIGFEVMVSTPSLFYLGIEFEREVSI